MCARNYHGGMDNPNLPLGEITYNEFKEIFNKEVLIQLEHIFFCGNFGDPILSNHLLSIVEYCKNTNPEISLGIHTNGSARDLKWWKQLSKVVPKNHCVHFALDGLEDTHHLYRIGTSFEKIIDNAREFIRNGGRAEWVFLSFRHNEHQIEEARKKAKDLGFVYFNLKSTSRFLEKPWFDVLDSNGNVSHKIEAPTEHRISFIRPEIVKEYKKITESAIINCKIKKDKSLYVDAFKNLWPCCWIGSIPYSFSKETDLSYHYYNDQKQILEKLIDSIGGADIINLNKNSIKNILENQNWQDTWSKHWEEKKLATCAKICGEFDQKLLVKPDEQFIKKEILNG
jgi:MoaA/NifB/PqqE/SkfB family radical SAM enzyme